MSTQARKDGADQPRQGNESWQSGATPKPAQIITRMRARPSSRRRVVMAAPIPNPPAPAPTSM